MSHRDVFPNVIMPNQSFFIGALLGFNAGRRFEKNGEDLEPVYGNSVEDLKNTSDSDYFGYFFETSCSKCGRKYCYDNLNEIPQQTLECETEECDNIVILYGVNESNLWRIGPISL